MLKSFIRRKLTAYMQEFLVPAVTEATAQRLTYLRRREQLTQGALYNKEKGTCPVTTDDAPVIVSLTTHGTRLYEVHLAIESIMEGTVKPQQIILWLDNDDERALPIALERQKERGLEVMLTSPMRSYAKLVPALRAFPEAHIVTIDDDVFYPHDFLERLIETHRMSLSAVIANSVMLLSRNDEGIPQGIRDWPYISTTHPHPTYDDLFFEGFGGVFYPAGCMPAETMDEALFLKLCPTADDVWFNAMTRRSATPVHVCLRSPFDFIAAVNRACQDSALNSFNNDRQRNDRQIDAVWKHFHLQGK